MAAEAEEVEEVGDKLILKSMSKKEILEKGKTTAKRVAIGTSFFAVAKTLIGFISGSIALLSDAFHSIGDVVEIFFVWLGFKISERKPTEKFPYGFYKAESIVALIVSALILYVGFEIAQESYQRIFTTYSLRIPQVALGIAILDAIFIYFLGRYEEKIGREINSQSLIADGKESKLHIISSSLVIFGIIFSYFGISRIEGVIGILLSLFVFKVGFESLKDAIYSLMDVSPSKAVEKKIKDIFKSMAQVEDFSNLRLRKSGPFIFGEVKIRVKKFLEVKRAHEIADEIEEEVKTKVSQLDSFLIHLEPAKKLKQKIIIPVKEKSGLNSQIDEHFGRAKFFVILKTKKDKIESLEFKENPFKEKKIRAGLSVVRFLSEEKPDVVLTKEIGPISLHTLRDNLIEVHKVEKGTVIQIMEDFFQNRLIRLKKPTRKKE